MSESAATCPECGAPEGRIHAFKCKHYPDLVREKQSAASRRGAITFRLQGGMTVDDIYAAGGATIEQGGRTFRLDLSTLIVDPDTGEATCEMEEVDPSA